MELILLLPFDRTLRSYSRKSCTFHFQADHTLAYSKTAISARAEYIQRLLKGLGPKAELIRQTVRPCYDATDEVRRSALWRVHNYWNE